MKIRKLDTDNKKDIAQFIHFPFALYKDCPQWVPPLRSEMSLVMNRKKHPFYRHSVADFFVAESEKDTLARVAVLNNNNYNRHHDSRTAFFYYFDTVNDLSVVQTLFEAVFVWARRYNLNVVLGPRGFLRSSGIGLLVEGFEFMPAMGIPYNFPYYQTLLENIGFEKQTDYLSGYLDRTQQLPQRMFEAAERIKERGDFWVKTFRNKKEMREFIPFVNEVHYKAFHKNPGFYPTTDEEFKMIANTMIQIAEPEYVKLIMKGADVVGFVLGYPNVSHALQKTKGKLLPFGWITILNEKRHTRLGDLNGVGLLPEYQGMGANILLYVELEKTLRQSPFEKVELVQVDERNFKSKSDMETLGVNWKKRHRLYQYPLFQ